MQPNETHRILIIEDDPDMGYTINEMLQAAGFRTMSVTDGQAGLTLALAHHPDVILLDLKLPKLSGKSVLSKLREDTHRIVVGQPTLMHNLPYTLP